MASNDTIIRVSVDASGVEAGVQRMNRSNAAYMASMDAIAERTQTIQAAIDEAAANGSQASTRQIKSISDNIAKYADTIGKTKGQQLEFQAAQAGILGTMQPLIDRIKEVEVSMKNAGGSALAMAESEEQATARISAMVQASLAATAAMADQSDVAARYAASVAEVAAAATKAERANAGLAASSGAVAASQVEVAAQARVASTVISDGAAKVTEALGRQLTALTATSAQMAVYDAQMAGLGAAEVAQIEEIAKEIDLRKQQIAQGEKMAAAYVVETGAAHGASLATKEVRDEIGVLGREAASGNFSRLASSFTRLLSLAGAMDLLLNPLTISVAAIGYAMLKVAEQTEKMNEALVMTGGYAGITSDQLRSMADAATAGGATFNTAAEAVTALAATGRLTGDEIANLGRTTADAATYTSMSVKQMVDEFTKLAEEPVKASVKLNDQYHYLTESTYDQIVALEKQGDATGAAQVAVEAFSTAMDARTKDIAANEGIILKGWRDIKGAINEAIEAVGSFGAPATAAQAAQRMDDNKAARAPIGQWSDQDEAERVAAHAKADAEIKAAQDKARSERQQQQLIDAKSAYDTWNAQFATPVEKRAKEIQKYIDTIATPLGLSPEQQLADEQQINDKYKDKKDPAARTNDNRVNASLAALQNQQKMIEDALRASLEHIKALRAEGVISEQDALTQSYVAEQAALQKRIDIDKQQEVIAEGKKNKEAYRKYADDIQRLQQQMTANYQKFGDDIGKMSEKEKTAVGVYVDSLNQQLQTQQTAASMKLASLSMGGTTKADYDAQIKLMEDYDKKRAALAKSLDEKKIGKDQYDAELKATQDYYNSSIDIARQSSADILAANQDWTTGASRAIQNYADGANNVAAQVDTSFMNMAKGMEDALATFVTTGKLNFKSLVDSMIADMVRMQARAAMSGLFSSLASLIGGGIAGSFGTLATTSSAASAASDVMGAGYSSSLMGPSSVMPTYAGLPQRAAGGPVADGSAYLVGERGPEMFVPQQAGSIVPNHALGGGGGVSVQIVNNSNSQVQQPQVSQDSSGQKFIRLIIDQAKNEMAGDMASGQGPASKALAQRFGLTPRFR